MAPTGHREPLGGAARRPHRDLHGGPGLLHRQRRDARDADRPHASNGAIEWVVAGYGLTFGTLLITAGRLGDQLGRRRMFTLGLALFTVASAACGVATSAEMLVVARLAQGVAAALLSPQVLAIIGVAYTGADRVRALSVYGIVLGLGAVGGQLIGGALVAADVAGLGWRSCFLINVPIGVAALVAVGRTVPESREATATRLDLVGTALITLGLVGVVLPLVEGRQHGWPLWTWLCLGAAPVPLGAFAAAPAPARPARRRAAARSALFRDRAFSAGLGPSSCSGPARRRSSSSSRCTSSLGRGLDALQAGLVFTILAVAYLVASMKAPALDAESGRRLPSHRRAVLAAGHGLLAPCVADVGRRLARPARPRAAARGRGHGPRHHAADLDGARVARAPPRRPPRTQEQ